jgi:hypothetical protein
VHGREGGAFVRAIARAFGLCTVGCEWQMERVRVCCARESSLCKDDSEAAVLGSMMVAGEYELSLLSEELMWARLRVDVC